MLSTSAYVVFSAGWGRVSGLIGPECVGSFMWKEQENLSYCDQCFMIMLGRACFLVSWSSGFLSLC